MGWMWASPEASAVSRDGDKAAPPPPSMKKPESDYGDPEIAKFVAQIQNEFGGGTSTGPSASRAARQNTGTTAEPPASGNDAASKSSSLWGSIWGSSSATSSQPPTSATQSAFPPSLSVPRETAATDTAQAQAPAWDGQADRPPPLDPISESLLPTTMSCRQAFDAAFYCQSVGSQFHAIYRAGTVRTCSQHWDDFWFCMRTRAYSGPVKEAAIRDHHRRREWARYGPGQPSSADVWESRDEKVKPGEAFQERYEPPDISDEEWRVAEVERRRQVQEALAREQRS